MSIDSRKVVVVGCGFVGSSSAFALMQSKLFSEMVLIDADHDRAEGEAMDISHGMAFASPMKIYAGTYDDITDAEVIVITAGANQKPDETRLDLIRKNSAIMKSIIGEIKKRPFEGILLIVSNPVDILTYIALKESGYPANRVIGSGTVLDTGRIRYELGEHLGVDCRSIHAFIIGEHGDSELAAWSEARVGGMPINDFCELRGHYDHEASMEIIFNSVKNSAYEIIEKKGATFYAVALAIRRIAEALIRDEHSLLTVSGYCSGAYEIEDVCIGLPMILGRDGIENIVEIPLNQLEKDNLHESANALKKILTDMGIN